MLTFKVPGIPEAKLRHRTRVVPARGGARAFATSYPDPKTVSYEAKIAECARLAGVPRLEGAVFMHVIAVYPCRKKTKRPVPREPKTTKPDFDNIAKVVADALIGIAYDDDSVVFDAHQTKWYGATGELPHIEIRLETRPQ